jgi:hypothetical protein
MKRKRGLIYDSETNNEPENEARKVVLEENEGSNPPFLNTRYKKVKVDCDTPPVLDWLSASDLKNYISKDTLVDWLKLTSDSKAEYNKEEKETLPLFTKTIIEKGIEFEDRLVTYLKSLKLNIVTVSDKITDESCSQTILYMKRGVPIIHSAPFRNEKNKTRGIIDLLVRSDKLHLITGYNPLDIKTRAIACNYSKKYHYIVIDIKFSTLPLKADGIHLLNSGNYPFYKSQLCVYTEGVGNIQGYTSRYAYILGRRWKYTSKDENYSGLSALDKYGTIDYEEKDLEYKEKTRQAVEWVRELRSEGRNWTVDPPSREELYPNMCINSGKWNSEKERIAKNISDITQVWYCGIKNRKNALLRGIKSWKDKRCTSSALGINGEKRAPVIDKILNINRQNKDKIRPKKLSKEMVNFVKDTNEVFVDFETFCDINDHDPKGGGGSEGGHEFPTSDKTNFIFMIGVYSVANGVHTYKNFVSETATIEGEYNIMKEFVDFLEELNYPKMWFWHADKTIWTKAEDRQLTRGYGNKNDKHIVNNITNWKVRNWSDLCDVFRSEPIVVKNCFKFGLKEIAKAMYEHGFIETKIESDCRSGLDASVLAWRAYTDLDESENKQTILEDIAEYNKFDVKVLSDILNYLRKNMC